MAENRIADNGGVRVISGTQAIAEKKVSVVEPGSLVSIIVPCCGMIEYTKMCVPSILRYTRLPFELIFLDIGSLDGTAEYLAGIKAASTVRVEIVRTPTDLGISDACKEAIREARGEYLVLLNNDTIVTDGWVQQMLNLASLSPAVGMVGPMSNYAPLGQLVENVPYRVKPKRGKTPPRFGTREALLDVDAMRAFAREYREKTKGKWIEIDRLGGFCLLLKRQVLDRIGLPNLEKWTDLSLFDTDILSAKARQVGFTLACCRDLFIHHFGTRTFSHGAPTDSAKPKEPRTNGTATT
jgi:O-antigen biosynthesis protein